MAKPFTVQHVRELSMIVLLAGVVLTAVGIMDLIGSGFKEIGSWGWWVAAAGVLLLLVGIIWFFSFRLNVKKFNGLMEEQSKAAFVRKLDDVEFLAWKLPMKYEDELLVKKKHFGMK